MAGGVESVDFHGEVVQEGSFAPGAAECFGLDSQVLGGQASAVGEFVVQGSCGQA